MRQVEYTGQPMGAGFDQSNYSEIERKAPHLRGLYSMERDSVLSLERIYRQDVFQYVRRRFQ